MNALPKSQRETLLHFGDTGAITRDTALDAYSGVNSSTVGALIRKGFAQKATVSRHRSQRTIYWLTDLGITEFAKYRDRRADAAARG